MHYARQISHFLLVLFMMASAASFAGCDSGGDDDDNGNGGQTGTFNVEITGEGVDDSFSGVAFFGIGEDPETGQDAFIIWLTPSQNQQGTTGVWFYLLNERPGTGTFTLVDLSEGEDVESELESSFGAMLWSENVTYLGTAGTIRLTSSSSTRVAGEFDFTAMGFSVAAPEGVQVTVEGSFNALTTGNIVFPF